MDLKLIADKERIVYLDRKTITVLRRPKLVGPGFHFGVEVDDFVYDYSSAGVLHTKTLDGFAAGHRVEVMYSVPWHDELSARERLRAIQLNPGEYRLLNWNCENVANWIATGTPKSDQINGLFVLGAFAALWMAASR